MAFIFINKTTNKGLIYGGLKALSKNENIKLDNLYTAFSRKKLLEFENEQYRIIKTDIIRG